MNPRRPTSRSTTPRTIENHRAVSELVTFETPICFRGRRAVPAVRNGIRNDRCRGLRLGTQECGNRISKRLWLLEEHHVTTVIDRHGSCVANAVLEDSGGGRAADEVVAPAYDERRGVDRVEFRTDVEAVLVELTQRRATCAARAFDHGRAIALVPVREVQGRLALPESGKVIDLAVLLLGQCRDRIVVPRLV